MTETSERTIQAVMAAIHEVEDEAPGGAEALFMGAMLAESPLPYDFALAIEGTPHNPALINPAAAFFAATATMEPLVQRELIRVDADAQIFQVAEDVRAILRDSMNDDDATMWAGRAIYALNLILPDADPQHWETVQWLMPHIEASRELVDRLGVATAAANRVLHQTGFALYYQQRYDAAADYLDAALAVDVAAKGRQHPDIAADLEGLGNVLWAGGQNERAEAAFAGCLALQQEILTKDNPMTAPILNSLAVIRQALGKFEQADETFKECLRVLTAAHGEGHPTIASCLSNYALLHESMGQPEQALRLAERALEINTAAYGEAHPDVASDLNTVALLHDALGNGEKAEACFRKSLSAREAVFGSNHPDTAQSLCNLALWLDNAGRTDEAVTFYEKGLAAYEAALGPGHPLMETALDNYITLLEKTGTRPATDRLRALTEAKLRDIVEKAGTR